MSTAAPASQPPPANMPRRWTLQQEELAREFLRDYGIEPKQISFDGEQPDPTFDYEALNLLAYKLGNFPMISTDLGEVDRENNLITTTCDISVSDGRMRHVTAAALIGDVLPNGAIIHDFEQALNVAQARALRKALRAVGWDALRAHRESKGDALTLHLPKESNNKELAEIHILAKEIGLIDEGGDKSRYRRFIGICYPGKDSARDLDDVQRATLIATFRALKNAGRNVMAMPAPSAPERNAQTTT